MRLRLMNTIISFSHSDAEKEVMMDNELTKRIEELEDEVAKLTAQKGEMYGERVDESDYRHCSSAP